jgi:hypothetical protein
MEHEEILRRHGGQSKPSAADRWPGFLPVVSLTGIRSAADSKVPPSAFAVRLPPKYARRIGSCRCVIKLSMLIMY